MNEFERRLAAALREAVAEARPPDRLTELVRRRHRRHRRQVGAVSLAAVAAIALTVPLATPVLTGRGSPVIGPASPSALPSSPIPTVTSPPSRGWGRRSVSEGCSWQIGGTFAKNWQRHSIHVGPVWIIDVLWSRPGRDASSPPRYGPLPIDVRDNAHVRIAVVGAARSYFRFLYGDSGSGGRYSLRDGQLSVSLNSCRRGHEMGFYPGWTQFWGSEFIARQRACVSLDVWTAPGQPPARVNLPVGTIKCGALVTRPG